MLTVTRKGGRRATVVLPPPTAAALDTYLADRAAGPLLATASGRLDQGALWKLVRRLARAAGIPPWAQLSPHSLRHAAITLALDAGARCATCRTTPGTATPGPHGTTTAPATPLDRNAAHAFTAYLA